MPESLRLAIAFDALKGFECRQYLITSRSLRAGQTIMGGRGDCN